MLSSSLHPSVSICSGFLRTFSYPAFARALNFICKARVVHGNSFSYDEVTNQYNKQLDNTQHTLTHSSEALFQCPLRATNANTNFSSFLGIICKVGCSANPCLAHQLGHAGAGCPKCAGNRLAGKIGQSRPAMTRLDRFEMFVQRAKVMHGDAFDYSQARDQFINLKSRVPIRCRHCRGIFLRAPEHHIRS